jgi:hypothetical protein
MAFAVTGANTTGGDADHQFVRPGFGLADPPETVIIRAVANDGLHVVHSVFFHGDSTFQVMSGSATALTSRSGNWFS